MTMGAYLSWKRGCLSWSGAGEVAGDVGSSHGGTWWPKDAKISVRTAALTIANRCRALQQ